MGTMTNVLPANRASVIGEALSREILRSDRRRVTLLIGVLGLMLVLVLAIRFTPGIVRVEIRENLLSAIWALAGILACYLLYEAAVRRWLGRLLEQRSSPGRWLAYLNVAIEVSLPTLVIAALAMAVGSLSALAGAVPFIYLLLIMTFVLSLDFRLCAFAGLLSCVEFIGLNLLLLRPEPASSAPMQPVLAMLNSPHLYYMKGILLLTGGLIAGFVAIQFRAQLARVIETLDERDRAISIFGQHVSPQVAELLLKQQVDYTGQQRAVCVMFLDIRDFSVFASAHSAPEVMSYLKRSVRIHDSAREPASWGREQVSRRRLHGRLRRAARRHG